MQINTRDDPTLIRTIEIYTSRTSLLFFSLLEGKDVLGGFQEINLIEARGGRLTRGISNVLKGCRGVLTVISFAVPKSVRETLKYELTMLIFSFGKTTKERRILVPFCVAEGHAHRNGIATWLPIWRSVGTKVGFAASMA
jgi:hypothetical protein